MIVNRLHRLHLNLHPSKWKQSAWNSRMRLEGLRSVYKTWKQVTEDASRFGCRASEDWWIGFVQWTQLCSVWHSVGVVTPSNTDRCTGIWLPLSVYPFHPLAAFSVTPKRCYGTHVFPAECNSGRLGISIWGRAEYAVPCDQSLVHHLWDLIKCPKTTTTWPTEAAKKSPSTQLPCGALWYAKECNPAFLSYSDRRRKRNRRKTKSVKWLRCFPCDVAYSRWITVSTVWLNSVRSPHGLYSPVCFSVARQCQYTNYHYHHPFIDSTTVPIQCKLLHNNMIWHGRSVHSVCMTMGEDSPHALLHFVPSYRAMAIWS